MRSLALTSSVDTALFHHLRRADGQEDLGFALWRPSQGRDRLTALITEPILPEPGDREVHGNASFSPAYFERALDCAMTEGAGLAFLHSHPVGSGWQGMSADDVAAESGMAAQTLVATGLPIVGLTLAGTDGAWSARFWERSGPREYERSDCATVRVVGEQLRVTYDERQRPRPALTPVLARTTSAWGEAAQADLARLQVGVVGAGSVGALVAEAVVRMGIERVRLIDFDAVEQVNRDRLLHATTLDAFDGVAKVESLARGLTASATAANPQIEPLELSIVEPDGLLAALDCDVLFSCVDRPWPRYVLNLVAYAHLIPVIDGGIAVERTAAGLLRGVNWRAHVAAPGRRCLECLEQYDPGLVQTERDGFFDDPEYIKRLPKEHPIRRNQNVFAFSMGCASLEIAQLISMVVAPGGFADYGAQTYHFATGTLDLDTRGCRPGCLFSTAVLGRGDHAAIAATGSHAAADRARVQRSRARDAPTGGRR
jgi:hypothetical protein